MFTEATTSVILFFLRENGRRDDSCVIVRLRAQKQNLCMKAFWVLAFAFGTGVRRCGKTFAGHDRLHSWMSEAFEPAETVSFGRRYRRFQCNHVPCIIWYENKVP